MYDTLTCPETGHLEMIELEHAPVGRLIVACSRFRPPDCMQCPRTCAARLDRRDFERTEVDRSVDATSVQLRR